MSDAAAKRHNDTLRWKNIWAGLLFALGIIIVLFLATACALIIDGTYLKGAISGFASLLSGGGFAWIWKRWEDARKDEREAFQDLMKTQKSVQEQKRIDGSRTAMLGKLNEK
jgi:hypothetical protein